MIERDPKERPADSVEIGHAKEACRHYLETVKSGV